MCSVFSMRRKVKAKPFGGSLLLAAAVCALAACPARPERAASMHDPVKEPIAAGREIFLQKCATCHGPAGEGIGKAIPPLAGAPWVTGSPMPLTALVLDGLKGEQTINGQRYSGIMPAWRGVLTDPEIAAVLTYIRQDWGNQAPPVSIDFVHQINQRYEARRSFWTAPELNAIPKE